MPSSTHRSSRRRSRCPSACSPSSRHFRWPSASRRSWRPASRWRDRGGSPARSPPPRIPGAPSAPVPTLCPGTRPTAAARASAATPGTRSPGRAQARGSRIRRPRARPPGAAKKPQHRAARPPPKTARAGAKRAAKRKLPTPAPRNPKTQPSRRKRCAKTAALRCARPAEPTRAATAPRRPPRARSSRRSRKVAPAGSSHERYRAILRGVNLSRGVAGRGRREDVERASERMRATVMWARKRRRCGVHPLPSASAAATRSCRRASSSRGSPISTASARGRLGGSHSGTPTDSSPTRSVHAPSAKPSASISPTGRLPRKHSVRCSDRASSTRSAPRALLSSPVPAHPGRARAQAASSAHTSGGGSTATNSLAVAPRDIPAGDASGG